MCVYVCLFDSELKQMKLHVNLKILKSNTEYDREHVA